MAATARCEVGPALLRLAYKKEQMPSAAME